MIAAPVFSNVKARELIENLLNQQKYPSARALLEASIHLPRRGSRWVASYRDETGKQVWKSTGQRGRDAAQAVADEWEQAARQKRLVRETHPKKPTIRVRPGSPEHQAGLLSHKEIAALWRVSERSVRNTEREALRKLFNHAELRAFWKEYLTGEVDEAAVRPSKDWKLTKEEIVALFAMTRTPLERSALEKALALTGQWPAQQG